MPLVFAAAMGGNLSLIGAPGNLIAQSVMEEMDMGFGFLNMQSRTSDFSLWDYLLCIFRI